MTHYWSKWLLGCCGLACPYVWAQEALQTVDAHYVAKLSDDKVMGLVTAYIDRPQLESVQGFSTMPYTESRYASFGIGPSFDINTQVRAYGVVGAATIADGEASDSAPVQALGLNDDGRMYGVGMSIRPNEQWQIDMQYQNAHLKYEKSDTKQVNYFNVGVAYRF